MTPAEIRTLVGNIFVKLRDHASALGVFEHVEGHALINPPPSGIGIGFEAGQIKPGGGSGLSVTSIIFTCTGSIYRTMQTQPADDLEVDISAAATALIVALSADLNLGGLVRNIDLLGSTGAGLSADPGYVKIGEQQFRASVVTIPMIVNDVFEQVN